MYVCIEYICVRIYMIYIIHIYKYMYVYMISKQMYVCTQYMCVYIYTHINEQATHREAVGDVTDHSGDVSHPPSTKFSDRVCTWPCSVVTPCARPTRWQRMSHTYTCVYIRRNYVSDKLSLCLCLCLCLCLSLSVSDEPIVNGQAGDFLVLEMRVGRVRV